MQVISSNPVAAEVGLQQKNTEIRNQKGHLPADGAQALCLLALSHSGFRLTSPSQ